jgi:hypothetical protein
MAVLAQARRRRDGGQSVTGGVGVMHGRPPAVCRRCKGGSGQPGDTRRPRALVPAPPSAASRHYARQVALPRARRRPARSARP